MRYTCEELAQLRMVKHTLKLLADSRKGSVRTEDEIMVDALELCIAALEELGVKDQA